VRDWPDKDKSCQKKRAMFLDRDGVMIRDRHYIRDENQVDLCEGCRDVVVMANKQEWGVVVVTNQSGIGRGIVKWEDYERVTDRMLLKIGNGHVDAIIACGDAPSNDDFSWRKPSPGMILYVADILNIDIEGSIMVGDRLSDIMAGYHAGIGTLVHTMTGHGENERGAVLEWLKRNENSGNQMEKCKLYLVDSLMSLRGACLGEAWAPQGLDCYRVGLRHAKP